MESNMRPFYRWFADRTRVSLVFHRKTTDFSNLNDPTVGCHKTLKPPTPLCNTAMQEITKPCAKIASRCR